MDMTIPADRGPAFDYGMGTDLSPITDKHVLTDHGIRTDFHIATQSGAWIYHCGFMNLSQRNHHTIDFHLHINSSKGKVRLTHRLPTADKQPKKLNYPNLLS